MSHKQTIQEYSASNILVLPESLGKVKDATLLHRHDGSYVYLKQLEHELVDLEFYTNTPCIIYITHGEEMITTSDNRTQKYTAGDLLFLPKGINLHSDFLRSAKSLKAFMLFYNNRLVSDFLHTQRNIQSEEPTSSTYSIKGCALIELYFSSFHTLFNYSSLTSELFELKLLELLHLILRHDEQQFLSHLRNNTSIKSTRNLQRLMTKKGIHQLSVSDLADLSGRSLSSFNRDFRKAYHCAPKQWLIDKRMEIATKLLAEREATVTTVASELGYDNISHFIKLFKAKYQLTPKQFIQQL